MQHTNTLVCAMLPWLQIEPLIGYWVDLDKTHINQLCLSKRRKTDQPAKPVDLPAKALMGIKSAMALDFQKQVHIGVSDPTKCFVAFVLA